MQILLKILSRFPREETRKEFTMYYLSETEKGKKCIATRWMYPMIFAKRSVFFWLKVHFLILGETAETLVLDQAIWICTETNL